MTTKELTIEPIVLSEASNEILHQYLKAGLARRLLGWRPVFTLEEGLQRTVAWYWEFFSTLAGADMLQKVQPEDVGVAA